MPGKIVLMIAGTLLGLPALATAQRPENTVMGEDINTALAESLAWFKKALQLEKEANWPAAIAAAEKSLALARPFGARTEPAVTALLQKLVTLHEARADFAAAAKTRAEVLQLQERRLGKDHWRVTDSRLALDQCKRLAGMDENQRRKWSETRAWIETRNRLHLQGKYPEATIVARKIVASCQTIWGEAHHETGLAINSLGSLLESQGQHADAEILNRRALAIYLKVPGENHPETASSHNLLASALRSQGQYAEAEKLDRKALTIRLKVQGEEHPETAISYNNLARDLHVQGQYAEAEKLDRKALAICLKSVGDTQPSIARSYHNLAADLRAQKQYAEAEKLDHKALAIRLQVYGEAHPDTANSYHNLAAYLRARRQYAEAEKLDRKVLAIRIKIGGEEHPDTDISYNNLAVDLREQGQYAELEKLQRHVLAISLKVRGEQHPHTAQCYANFAHIFRDQGMYEAAEKMALDAAKSYQAARVHVSYTGLDRSAFSAEHSPMALLACLLAHNGKPAQAWDALEHDLGRGLFDDLTARTARPLNDKERRREETLLSRLADIDKRLPDLLSGKSKNLDEADQLRKVRDGLMVELTEFQTEMVNHYGVLAGEVYGLERIQKSLAVDAAFVAWVDRAGHPKSKTPAGDHWAVIVRSKGEPVWVRLIGIGRDGAWSEKDDGLPGEVLKILHNPDLDPVDVLAKLARQRLTPLEKHLKGIRHLLMLPSTRMAGIPIETLTDAYRISYVPSATTFAWLNEKRNPLAAGNTLLALGDAVFSPEQARNATAVAQLVRGSEKFAALPGTRFEVERLAGLVKKHGGRASPFLGLEANRVNLERLAEQKQLADFRYIHLATHAKADPRGGLNSYLVLSSENPDATNYATLSAGQILRTWRLNADLVTLSACQTGLGELQGGEGYVGFSQALLLAGARTLVLSQWQVSDHASAAFMVRFYQNLLGDREGLKAPMNKIEALEEARHWLRELPRAEAAKLFADMPKGFRDRLPQASRPFEHPNYWAAFILVGDPGTLQPSGK